MTLCVCDTNMIFLNLAEWPYVSEFNSKEEVLLALKTIIYRDFEILFKVIL